MFCDLGEGHRITGPHGSPQILGLLAELLETGLLRERDGRHCDSFRAPAVRVARPKGGINGKSSAALRRALPFPRTGGLLQAYRYSNPRQRRADPDSRQHVVTPHLSCDREM
jgi:hypothetical protein